MSTKALLATAQVLLALPLVVHGAPCAFMEGTPIELELPVSVLSHPLVDLSIKFDGFASPVVRRRTRKAGTKPKIIVSRYSTEPSVAYDELTGSVMVTAGDCDPVTPSGEEGTDGDSGASLRAVGLAAFSSLLLASPLDPVVKGMLSTLAVLPWAQAEQTRKLDECSPQVEVFVEAPDAYMGAVETCLAEVSESGHCPEPFPTYATCSDANPTCAVAVVGGGTAGLY
mmetsp:Transcript_722/g.1010  ORF Transcript_722/g.1010 Transcript_722/m.1010 type:complete len:227 (-) Transcript_722:555-1235(-)